MVKNHKKQEEINMEQRKTRKGANVTTRKNIQALIYFCGGIMSCYYSFKKMVWMCLEGFEEMFYVGEQFSTGNCIGAIIFFIILIIAFVVSACFFITEAEQYYEKYREQKQIQKEKKRN